jgi:type VI secretion system protein ImpA
MRTRLDQRRPVEGAENGVAGDHEANGVGGGAPRGPLRSREDVIRTIDNICAYYATHEPSSPVPLLLERCKRLVTMSFIDIVKDLVPDSLSAIHNIAGQPKE